MENKKRRLKPHFAMFGKSFIPSIKEECLDILNLFLRSKAGIDYDPIFLKEEFGKVKVGYIPAKNSEYGGMFQNNLIERSDDLVTRVAVFQFVIFEACRSHGCFKDVPMVGAPEENIDTYFEFTFNDVNYKFILWEKE
ncbi:MAG: hypothetical protein QG630_288 [Patescibacteria group bacterium]|nr:hypothetical protein [Patescibacteria group bacterium]